MTIDTKNLTRRATEIALALWAFKIPIAVALVALVVVYYLVAWASSCEWKNAEKHAANADNSAANAQAIDADRERIKANATRDLDKLNEKGNEINANLSNSYNSISNLDNARPGNVSGASLDADAERYRNRKRADRDR